MPPCSIRSDIDQTIGALLAAQGPGDEDTARLEAARRAIIDADDKIARLIAAIEAGCPANLLGPRLEQLRGSKLAAERGLLAASPTAQLDETALRQMIAELGPITAVLADADPEAKAKLYNELDLELTFDAERRLVKVEAAPAYSASGRRTVSRRSRLAGTPWSAACESSSQEVRPASARLAGPLRRDQKTAAPQAANAPSGAMTNGNR